MVESEISAAPACRLSVRMGKKGYALIERRAVELDIPISRMVRRLLAYALQNMPKDWAPGQALPGAHGKQARR